MSAKTPVASLRRKNIVLDQKKIDRVKRIFGAATETEAIDRALDQAADLAAFRRELDMGFKELLGKGGFKDHFPGGE
jgi:hypothetical protein